jgi:NodT family efflux transporter outer membrane factor (OMF) lipoprotein
MNMLLRNITWINLIGFTAVILSACSPTPQIVKTENPLARQEPFLNDPQQIQVNQVMARWWERLEDPVLNDYIETLLANNLSLREASERVIQATERANIQRGGLFPGIAANAQARRSFTPTNSFATQSLGVFDTDRRVYNTNLNAELAVSWQADLFGRIRESVKAAEVGMIASQYDREALLHSLLADLVNRRVAVAVTSRLLALAREVGNNQQGIYDLVKRRYDLGTATTRLSDVYLSEENLRTVQTDISLFERQLVAEQYRLDILLGQVPGSTSPSVEGFSLLPPSRDVASCLPIDLLDRRPDLRASGLRVLAAESEISVAMADLYPGLNLGATIGVTGDRAGDLFSSEQLAGSILASITSRLFEGGRLRANIRLQEAEARELSSRYAANALDALREVETALYAEQALQRELAVQEQSLVAIRNAEELSLSRYRQGIEPLRDYLDIQRRRYLIEQTWLRLLQDTWSNRILLYLSLGGDWFDEQGTGNISNACSSLRGNT